MDVTQALFALNDGELARLLPQLAEYSLRPGDLPTRTRSERAAAVLEWCQARDLVPQLAARLAGLSAPFVAAPLPGGEAEALLAGPARYVPVRFLADGVEPARAVLRVRSGTSVGTGFLVAPDRVATALHVLTDSAVEVDVDVEDGPTGDPVAARTIRARPGATSEAHDLAILTLDTPLTDRAPLTLAPSVAPTELVVIVHHPRGKSRRLSLARSVVSQVGPDRLQYQNDTESGSSGAPVFNVDWQVVAVHRAGRVPVPGKPALLANEGVRATRLGELLGSVTR